MRIVAPIQKILLVKQNFQKKKLFSRGNFTLFMSKILQIGDNFFQLILPKDSENLKRLNILDIELWEVGGKKTFKWSEQIKKNP